MGCNKSKLDDKVCLRDETTKMHQDFIKKNGLDAYYAIMGVPKEVIQPGSGGIEDKSQTYNVGLLNYESKEETTNNSTFDFEFNGKVLVELIVGFLIVVYILKRLLRYCKSKKQKASKKKSLEMKELMKETMPTAPHPVQSPYHPHYPMALTHMKNKANSNTFKEIPIIKAIQQDSIPNAVMPLFPNSLYD